ncbi:selenocysteine-specific translation elongation factor [Kocuria marina]|uniref:Selenocysteine-specific elongation factor n=1 Tax=Kocuria marina subsp. indica TaxID=1049583 RepID=A0A1X7DFG8_9MICC|nr:selenocysteine-specific translation elongation factor [Kocuria indica]OXS82746.1 selenocysteine-specific translation elongation factor [Kocuria indica]RLP57540.1 selenocysteine-specific translation elongation factor [Kocuria indica]SMF14561.1 selenocysteine-specific elongation factor [Kocuria indica]
MYVVATAGHVDHGKSTLVRALTGIEPDRWDEEKQRGLTIDLGFAWTELPSGRHVAFVDVPGHERFLGNMLAGVGPAPVVCFVVAADEGWQAQSRDHRDAVAALGIEYGMIVVTKADRAPERVADVVARARAELAHTGLADAPAVAVSAREGTGLDEFRDTLDAVLSRVPAPDPDARIRLWIDRAFTISGAGTVITGTLTAGTLHTGDRLTLRGRAGEQEVTVRSVQSQNDSVARIGPTHRVAVNLRGTSKDAIHRGDVLMTPDAWPSTGVIEVRRERGAPFDELPAEIVVHAGTAGVGARIRPLDADHARLHLDQEMTLVPGDRLVLRSPGAQVAVGGARVLDIDPPALDRRGAAAREAARLAAIADHGDPVAETVKYGAVSTERLRLLGFAADETPSGDVVVADGWWIHAPRLAQWATQLRAAVEAVHERDPLAPGLPRGAARTALGEPGGRLLDTVVARAQLTERDGYITVPGRGGGLGTAEAAIAALEKRLRAEPFAAPEAYELQELRLGPRELATAQRLGRVLRLPGDVVLLPTAPALAMRELARLPQPFTTSQARQAWGTTRRVAVPLLEHLDAKGWTRREDGSNRSIVR